MKSEIEIKDILYRVIKGSALEESVAFNGGALYKTQRPSNSGKEDIVISVLDGLNGQFQDAVINVNIYVQDVHRELDMIENESRIRELSRLAIELLESYNGGDYLFEIEKQKTLRVETSNEHCINNRIKLTINNF